MDRKAELRDIDRLNDLKANKDQIKQVESLINALNTRMKHMSILQAEIAKSAVPNKASSSFKASENLNTKL